MSVEVANDVASSRAAEAALGDNDFDWLRDPGDPKVQNYIRAENDAGEVRLAPLKPLRRRIFEEVLNRVILARSNVPARDGPWLYFSESEDEKPYLVHRRRRVDGTGPVEIVLDENVLADESGYLSVPAIAVSPDHRFCAYLADTTGQERHCLGVVDIATGRIVALANGMAGAGLAWFADGRQIAALRLDQSNRPDRLVRHCIDRPDTDGEIILHEPDPAFRLSVAATESGDFLVAVTAAQDTTELHLINAHLPEARPRLIYPRRNGTYCRVTHIPPHFYRLERRPGHASRILRLPETSPDATGEVIHSAPDGGEITGLHAFARYLVVTERHRGLAQLRVIPTDGGSSSIINLPENYAALYPEENREFEGAVFRFGLDSFVTPYSVYDYDMAARQLVRRDQIPVADYDPDRYIAERLDVSASDGTLVPLSVLRRRDFVERGPGPVLLYGYGAYGYSLEPDFSSLRLSLLDRGIGYAVAHVRGGGELGKDWHRAGRGLRKETSVTDFIACADALVARGIAVPGRLAAMGESAGGFLVAAAMNRRPELFAAVAVDCPFVDAVGVLSDPDLPFTPSDRLEWGDPTLEQDLTVLRSLSPLENVAAARYPAILALCSLNDPRTPYWETLSWISRIRDRAHPPLDISVQVRAVGGHQGASDRLDQVDEWALIYAFLIDRLGAPADPIPPE